MTESEPEQTTTMLKQRQERAGYEAAIRLQEHLDKEERQRIAMDAEVAQKLQEEIDITKRQRMAQLHQVAHGFTDVEWDDVLARVVAGEDFIQQLQAGGYNLLCLWVLVEVQRLKKAGQEVLEEPVKRQNIREASGSGEEQSAEKEKELSEEELQKLLLLVLVGEVYVEALQVKYPIIDCEVYSEDTRRSVKKGSTSGLQGWIWRIRMKSIRHMAPLPPHDQRHRFLRYEGLEYTDSDIADFELRLERIYTLEIYKVQVVDFLGFEERMSWRQFILALGLHTGEEMESPDFTRYWRESERMIPGKGDLHDYWRDILTDGDFLRPPPFYTLIRDPVLRLCQRMMAHSIAGRSQAPEKMIDMAKSGKATDLYFELDDTWAWVAIGPESELTYQAFDGSFRGSSPTAFQRQTSQRTGEVSTSTAQYDQQYPDP
ncbi:hypothetical protein Tco_0779936 [Tanacetum coccineum]